MGLLTPFRGFSDAILCSCVVKFPGSRDLISGVYTRNFKGLKIFQFVCLKTSISDLRYHFLASRL